MSGGERERLTASSGVSNESPHHWGSVSVCLSLMTKLMISEAGLMMCGALALNGDTNRWWERRRTRGALPQGPKQIICDSTTWVQPECACH